MPDNQKHQLPTIEVLFKQSWELFKACFFKLLILFSLTVGIYILVAIIVGLLIVIFGLSVSFSNPTQILATLLSPAVLTTAGIVGVLTVVGLTYLNVLLQIAVLKVVYEGKEHNSVIQTIKDSRSLVWPVFLVNLLAGLITFGGFMLLVIPGIVLSLLLSFAQFEVLFNDKRPIEALRRSFALFATDFWGIFGRIILFVLLSLLITAITTSLGGRGTGPLLSWIVSTLVSWFGIAYSLTIYKELRQVHQGLPGKNIIGLVITALVGYLLFILFSVAGVNLFLQYKDSLFSSGLNQYERQNHRNIMTPPNMQNFDRDDSMMEYGDETESNEYFDEENNSPTDLN